MQSSTLLGVYANGHTGGQESHIHSDHPPSESGMTALLFTSQYWATTWGGETVFYDYKKENLVASVQPKPGRLVVFDGRMPHQVRAPSLTSTALRTSIVFKTING